MKDGIKSKNMHFKYNASHTFRQMLSLLAIGNQINNKNVMDFFSRHRHILNESIIKVLKQAIFPLWHAFFGWNEWIYSVGGHKQCLHFHC